MWNFQKMQICEFWVVLQQFPTVHGQTEANFRAHSILNNDDLKK